MAEIGTDIASTTDKIKVWFKITPREDWLPYDTEGLWATRVGADSARIENVPFLRDGVAQGEIVRFATGEDGLYWASGRLYESGNCTLRVIPLPDGPLGGSAAAVHEKFTGHGFDLGGEVFSADFPLVAFNVPAGSDFAGIKALLARGEQSGWWHFEVSCATDEWTQA